MHNAEVFGDRPAVREKQYGIWQTWTWKQVKDEILAFAAGLQVSGLSKGDKVAIIGRNRPRLYWSITAVQCVGGIPVPVYADSVADEMQYVLNHAEARFVIAEDQEQVDKVLEVRDRLPALDQIIYDDEQGLGDYDQSKLPAFADVQRLGEEQLSKNANALEKMIAEGKGEEPGIFLYTSGTTGTPKGVVLTNDNIIVTSRNSVEVDQLTAFEETLSYLPMAWVGDHIFSHGQALCGGVLY